MSSTTHYPFDWAESDPEIPGLDIGFIDRATDIVITNPWLSPTAEGPSTPQAYGFEPLHTGGGCMAYYRLDEETDTTYLMTDQDFGLPVPGGPWELVAFRGDTTDPEGMLWAIVDGSDGRYACVGEAGEVERVRDSFITVIREDLTLEEVLEVVRRNDAEDNPEVCHTHDFCDANEAMIEAMARVGIDWVFGVDSDDPDHDRVQAQIEDQTAVLNAAWEQARAMRFRVVP